MCVCVCNKKENTVVVQVTSNVIGMRLCARETFWHVQKGLDAFRFFFKRIQGSRPNFYGKCCFGIEPALDICMVTHIARVWINRVRLPILLVVS